MAKKEDISYIDTKWEVAAYLISTIKAMILNKRNFKRLLKLILVSALAGGIVIGIIYAVKIMI